jgi:hypothetical protein
MANRKHTVASPKEAKASSIGLNAGGGASCPVNLGPPTRFPQSVVVALESSLGIKVSARHVSLSVPQRKLTSMFISGAFGKSSLESLIVCVAVVPRGNDTDLISAFVFGSNTAHFVM